MKTVLFDLDVPLGIFENRATLLLCCFRENKFPYYPKLFSIRLSVCLILHEVKVFCDVVPRNNFVIKQTLALLENTGILQT